MSKATGQPGEFDSQLAADEVCDWEEFREAYDLPTAGAPPLAAGTHDVIISISTSTSGAPEDLVQRVRREMELLLGEDRFTLSVTPW